LSFFKNTGIRFDEDNTLIVFPKTKMKKTILILILLLTTFLIPKDSFALTPIARVDVVPLQRIEYGQTFNFGVIAFHKQGIQKVEFSISGQGYSRGIKTATEMTYNPRTDVYEYWVPIASNEFTGNGQITVTATAYGNDGGLRVLPALNLIVEATEAYNHPKAWVSPTGNDSTGVVGDSSHPYATIIKAIQETQSVNGGSSDGVEIHINNGEYVIDSTYIPTTSNDWLTIIGESREGVVLKGDCRLNRTEYLHIKNMTIKADPGATHPLFYAWGAKHFWVEDVTSLGNSEQDNLYSNAIQPSVYKTYGSGRYDINTEYRNIRNALGNVRIARGIVVDTIYNDVFNNADLVVNVQVNHQRNTTGEHADIYQIFTNSNQPSPDNRIIFGLKASDCSYQGFFMNDENNSGDFKNMALVNILIEMRDPPSPNESGLYSFNPFSQSQNFDNFIVWNCTFPMGSSAAYGHLTNSSLIGNVFYQFRSNETPIGDASMTSLSHNNTDGNECLYNHFMYVYDMEGADSCTQTTVDIAKDDPCPHWAAKAPDSGASFTATVGGGVINTTPEDDVGRPVGTVLLDRFNSVVPVDVNGDLRGEMSSVGAYEYAENQTIRADVDNNSTINTTDAMLTLRNSLGLNMSNTNWFSSATTGDVNCDNVSNSTDAMLILRHSLGLDMSGTGWCG
jgi:hypothetical protein